ncbi:MAG: hypothetical protein KBI39_01395 [Firmicutes bacterium]|nr:hypothetical protein [Candidatus Fermentithermobacillaceae bacterium]HON87055.1 hypothetical protein [Bacillota bacterium]HOV65819.1 hypothetical protein [Bacillota bacterium]HRC53279.1 hypothetical protein [Bacillota bacterium]
MTTAQVWVAALCTLAVYSYLYKENPAYRIAEYTLVALYTSYSITLDFHEYLIPYAQRYAIEEGQWYFWVMGALGLLLYFRYAPPKYNWLARYPISIAVGWGLGYNLIRLPRPVMVQVRDAMRPLNTVNNVLFFVFFLCILFYFFFTTGKESKFIQGSGRIGRYIMMVGFGCAFGNTVQGRISLFLNRLSFLLIDWLGIQIW